MRPRTLHRLKAHLAKFGVQYSGPRPAVPLPQICAECANKAARGFLLPADQGRFVSPGRWVCHPCLESSCESPTSIGERWLHRWLKSHHVEHEMNVVIDGTKFDCRVPKWNLLIEVDSYTGHHTVQQRKQDGAKDTVAKAAGYQLLRVSWNDPQLFAKVDAAREQGMALRKQLRTASA